MATRSKWQQLATEAVNPRSRDIDTLTPDEIVEVMILDNRHVLAAVQREKTRIARSAEIVADAVLERWTADLRRRGHERQARCARSGRAAADIRHRPATRRSAIMAGGPAAVHRAKEGVEDDYDEGDARDARGFGRRARMSSSAFPPAASRRSCAAPSRARAPRGPAIIGITCDPRSELKQLADVAIVLAVGPEVIAGSTRLKAGTATKVVLNMLTTAAMVRAGKTYGNLMVDVKSNSEKLRDRARRIIGSRDGTR